MPRLFAPCNLSDTFRPVSFSSSAAKMNENADSKHGLEELNQITMDNGREIIAKLPNPNAGRPHFTAASEVATMDFV